MLYRLYGFLTRVPLAWLYGLATLAAWLLQHVFRYRRRVVDTNLANAFPDMPEEERKQLRRDFYANFADTAVEIIAGAALPLEAFRARIEMDGAEILNDLSRGGEQSVLITTLHQGNWEWMMHRAAAEYSMQGAFVYKRLHSQGADRFSLEQRGRFGYEGIEMKRVGRDLIRNRRTPRLIVMVADQSPGDRERNHWTTFLNQQTAFFGGTAALARATGFPVAFAGCKKTRRGHYRITVQEVARDPKSLTDAEITERYARLAEASIKASPADWLWSNRRWKTTPPQANVD